MNRHNISILCISGSSHDCKNHNNRYPFHKSLYFNSLFTLHSSHLPLRPPLPPEKPPLLRLPPPEKPPLLLLLPPEKPLLRLLETLLLELLLFELPNVRVLADEEDCERLMVGDDVLLREEPPLKVELPGRTAVRLFVLFTLVPCWNTRPVRALVVVPPKRELAEVLPEREALPPPKRYPLLAAPKRVVPPLRPDVTRPLDPPLLRPPKFTPPRPV